VAHEDGPSKNRLYSDDEVTNPGYPGALLVLGLPLALMGLAIGVVAHLKREDGHAAIGLLLLLVPGVSLITKALRARRAQRREAWACRGCGYDRRGLAESAVCPECGADSSK